MEIQLAEALKRTGDTFPFEGTVTPGKETYLGRELVFSEPIELEGSFLFNGETVEISGTAKAKLVSQCARCGEPFEETLAFDFSERFEKAPRWAEEHDTYPFEGDVLCPDTMVMDNLFLNLPLVSVCREDCKGLCPVCGVNRNLIDCGCEQTDKENPFSVLKQMTNDYKEV